MEVFCEDPDTMIAGAVEAGATSHNDLQDHQVLWRPIGRVVSQIRSDISGWLVIGRL